MVDRERAETVTDNLASDRRWVLAVFLVFSVAAVGVAGLVVYLVASGDLSLGECFLYTLLLLAAGAPCYMAFRLLRIASQPLR